MRTRPDGRLELGSLGIAIEGDRLQLTHDDGERFDVNVHELLAEVDYELVADALADADFEALRRAA